LVRENSHFKRHFKKHNFNKIYNLGHKNKAPSIYCIFLEKIVVEKIIKIKGENKILKLLKKYYFFKFLPFTYIPF